MVTAASGTPTLSWRQVVINFMQALPLRGDGLEMPGACLITTQINTVLEGSGRDGRRLVSSLAAARTPREYADFLKGSKARDVPSPLESGLRAYALLYAANTNTHLERPYHGAFRDAVLYFSGELDKIEQRIRSRWPDEIKAPEHSPTTLDQQIASNLTDQSALEELEIRFKQLQHVIVHQLLVWRPGDRTLQEKADRLLDLLTEKQIELLDAGEILEKRSEYRDLTVQLNEFVTGDGSRFLEHHATVLELAAGELDPEISQQLVRTVDLALAILPSCLEIHGVIAGSDLTISFGPHYRTGLVKEASIKPAEAELGQALSRLDPLLAIVSDEKTVRERLQSMRRRANGIIVEDDRRRKEERKAKRKRKEEEERLKREAAEAAARTAEVARKQALEEERVREAERRRRVTQTDSESVRGADVARADDRVIIGSLEFTPVGFVVESGMRFVNASRRTGRAHALRAFVRDLASLGSGHYVALAQSFFLRQIRCLMPSEDRTHNSRYLKLYFRVVATFTPEQRDGLLRKMTKNGRMRSAYNKLCDALGKSEYKAGEVFERYLRQFTHSDVELHSNPDAPDKISDVEINFG